MHLYDFRDPRAVMDDGIENRTYIVLSNSATYLFHWGGGNKRSWPELELFLQSSLPGGFHTGICDVSKGHLDVTIDGRCDPEAAAWICNELVRREVVPSSWPAYIAHTDGFDEPLGAVGGVSARFMECERGLAYA